MLFRSPAFHCGIWAMRHFPAASEAPESRLYGIQAPVSREASLPLPSERFQSSDQPTVLVSMRSSEIIRCQKSVNRFAPASPVRLMVTFVPLVLNGRPPACQTMES